MYLVHITDFFYQVIFVNPYHSYVHKVHARSQSITQVILRVIHSSINQNEIWILELKLFFDILASFTCRNRTKYVVKYMLLFVSNLKIRIFKNSLSSNFKFLMENIMMKRKRAKNVDLPPGDLNARLRTISAQNLNNFRQIWCCILL